jgi:coenzyme F420 hydrogenase subunit delta
MSVAPCAAGDATSAPDTRRAPAAGVHDALLPDFCSRPTLILGCGNTLYGDDGFGCELVSYLERHYPVPATVCLLDVGTGVRKLLFTLCLSPERPGRILVLDALDVNRPPGEIVELDAADIPAIKLDDFSLHQVPTSNLLRELELHCGVEVRVLACQHGPLPDEVRPGLSAAVRAALPTAAAWVAKEYFATA